MRALELSHFNLGELTSEDLKSTQGGFFASGSTWFWRGFGLGFAAGGAGAAAALYA